MKTLLLSLLVAFAASALQAADPVRDALQRGLVAEEAERDFDKAATAYREAVRLGEEQQAALATALFRLAETERRLGRTNEAALLYRRLVSDFPAQTHLTDLARQYVSPPSSPETELSRLWAENDRLAGLRDSSEVNFASIERQFKDLNLALVAEDLDAAIKALEPLSPGSELERLRADRNTVRVELAALGTRYTTNHPAVKGPQAKLKEIETLLKTELDAAKGSKRREMMAALEQRVRWDERLKTLRVEIRKAEVRVTPDPDAASAKSAAERLLREEIAVAEAQLRDAEKRQETDNASAAEVFKAQRELLALRRQLASLPTSSGAQESAAGSAPRETPVPEDEETRKIRWFERMQVNSPDLLNAPQGIGNNNDETPLQTAARSDQQRVVAFLLKSGGDINATGNLGTTALYQAAAAGHKAMVDLLIRNGADANARAGEGSTPLLAAVGMDRPAVVSSLLAAGASPNLRSRLWRLPASANFIQPSPFGLAVALARSNAVEQMARKGADLDAVALDNELQPGVLGSTPLGIALNRRHWPMAEQLLRLGANPAVITGFEVPAGDGSYRPESGLPIQIAVRFPDVPLPLLDRLQPPDSPLDGREGLGPELLRQAIQSRSTNAVRWLLDHGANANATAANGRTPLLTLTADLSENPAGTAEALTLLDLLLQRGADVNRTVGDKAPLAFALASLNTNFFARLLKAGADPRTRTKDNRPMLFDIAQGSERPEMIANAQALLEAGADPNEEWYGYTALDFATRGSPALVELLLQFKADPNHWTPDGYPPLLQLKLIRQGAVPESVMSEEQARRIEAALRAAGAREDALDFGGIGILRPSFNRMRIRRLGTNDFNRFTLMDTLALACNVVPGPIRNVSNVLGPPGSAFPFPDWSKIVLRRPSGDGLRWEEMPFDLSEVFAGGGCSNNVPLRWGDVVIVPKRDHLASEKGVPPAQAYPAVWTECLKRTIQLTVRDQTAPLVLSTGSSQSNSFTLAGALHHSQRLWANSDLSRVTLRRRDPETGETREWVVDCRSDSDAGNQVWLLDGDEVLVPDL